MRTATSCLVLAALCLPPATASAQGRSVHVSLGGGPTFTLGDVADRFNTGWGPAIGVSLDLDDRLGLQFEYAYRRFSLKDEFDEAAGVLDANHQTHQLALDGVLTLTGPASSVRAYALAGPALYYRTVEITRYEGSGSICDPWLLICGNVPVGGVLGSRGGWDFGINAGGGVGFRFSDGGEFFIESRYHYVWGPDVDGEGAGPGPGPGPGNGPNAGRSNGQYWPLTFGVRF
jgi:hypothetical protein